MSPPADPSKRACVIPASMAGQPHALEAEPELHLAVECRPAVCTAIPLFSPSMSGADRFLTAAFWARRVLVWEQDSLAAGRDCDVDFVVLGSSCEYFSLSLDMAINKGLIASRRPNRVGLGVQNKDRIWIGNQPGQRLEFERSIAVPHPGRSKFELLSPGHRLNDGKMRG